MRRQLADRHACSVGISEPQEFGRKPLRHRERERLRHALERPALPPAHRPHDGRREAGMALEDPREVTTLEAPDLCGLVDRHGERGVAPLERKRFADELARLDVARNASWPSDISVSADRRPDITTSVAAKPLGRSIRRPWARRARWADGLRPSASIAPSSGASPISCATCAHGDAVLIIDGLGQPADRGRNVWIGPDRVGAKGMMTAASLFDGTGGVALSGPRRRRGARRVGPVKRLTRGVEGHCRVRRRRDRQRQMLERPRASCRAVQGRRAGLLAIVGIGDRTGESRTGMDRLDGVLRANRSRVLRFGVRHDRKSQHDDEGSRGSCRFS